MSPIEEAGLTALREIRRNLRSTKGIAMFALFFLGGAVPSVIQVLLQRSADGRRFAEMPDDLKREAFQVLLERFTYDQATAAHLSHCPPALFLILYKGTILFVPLLILLVGFEQIAGDIQHRGIRYLAGRARRSSIVAGKALGTWAVIAVMVLVLHLTVWISMLVFGTDRIGPILAWGPRLWLFSSVYTAAWVGVSALVSSFFRTPIVSLFVGSAVFFGLWITYKIFNFVDALHGATWAYPFAYVDLLESPEPLRVLGGVAALVAWGAVMVLGASAVMNRRDI
jgi:hypothetical protein